MTPSEVIAQAARLAHQFTEEAREPRNLLQGSAYAAALRRQLADSPGHVAAALAAQAEHHLRVFVGDEEARRFVDFLVSCVAGA